MGFFLKIAFDVWLISPTIELARFAEELQRFVYDRTTPPIIEKLRSKGIAMHTYGVSVYDAYTGSQLNVPGWSHSK